VLDFGVAKTRASLAQTRDGVIKGTARYMAREAVLGLPVDRRADVYMAGVVLWQLVTGCVPFRDQEDMAVLFAVARERLAPIRELDPELPRVLEAIVLRATHPEPSERFASAGEFRDALVSFSRDGGLSSNPDRLAALVNELAGEECQGLRRRIDAQLLRASSSPDAAPTFSGTRPSHPPSEPSNSRVRPTPARLTLSQLKQKRLVIGAGGALALCAVVLGIGPMLSDVPKVDAARAAPVAPAVQEPKRATNLDPMGKVDLRERAASQAHDNASVPRSERAPVQESQHSKVALEPGVEPSTPQRARPAPEPAPSSAPRRRSQIAGSPTEPLPRDRHPADPGASVPGTAEPAAAPRAARMIDKTNPWAQ
jgi:eukaryotic-like serine/threonine-protein kinase